MPREASQSGKLKISFCSTVLERDVMLSDCCIVYMLAFHPTVRERNVMCIVIYFGTFQDEDRCIYLYRSEERRVGKEC